VSHIDFSIEEKAILSQKLKAYIAEELDHEVGQFESEFLLDFISETVGPYYYNKGLSDASAVIAAKFEDIAHALYEIEAPL
jgi:uncharacterized protein (DUF2164 family)